MNICLSHWSALECWRSIRQMGNGLVDVVLNEKVSAFPKGEPPSITSNEASNLAHHLNLSMPLQLSIPNSFERRARGYCTFMRQRKTEPIETVCELEEGLCLPYPETVFLQLCKSLDAIDAAKLGYELSSSYRLNGDSIESAIPLLDVDRLKNAASVSSRRARELALRSSRNFIPGAESPAEINLALKLFLPMRYGGLGIKGAQLNPRLELSNPSRTLTGKDFCRADIFFKEIKLDIEYDSAGWHSTMQQLTEDMKRRTALRQDGHTVISIDSQVANSPKRLQDLGRVIAKRQGRRLAIDSEEFSARQHALFKRLGPTFAPVERPREVACSIR